MREIKFRGKRIDNGEWVYGSLINNLFFRTETGEPIFYIVDPDQWEDYSAFEDVEHLAVEVDPETVGQYTGFSDENGTDIYEKDIFQHEKDTGTVVFRNGMFCFEWDAPHTWGKTTLLWNLHDGGHVIGGNPELLGEVRE